MYLWLCRVLMCFVSGENSFFTCCRHKCTSSWWGIISRSVMLCVQQLRRSSWLSQSYDDYEVLSSIHIFKRIQSNKCIIGKIKLFEVGWKLGYASDPGSEAAKPQWLWRICTAISEEICIGLSNVAHIRNPKYAVKTENFCIQELAFDHNKVVVCFLFALTRIWIYNLRTFLS